MTQQFTDEDFKALAQKAAAMSQQQEQQPMVQTQPSLSPLAPPTSVPFSSRVLLAIGAGIVGIMGLSAIAGLMQRPAQPQATVTPSPTSVAVASPSPSPTVTPSPAPVAVPTHIVWGNPGDLLNIRSTPDQYAGVVGEIHAGTAIAVTDRDERWATVSWQGVSGYVSKKFLIPIGQDKGGR